MHETDAEALLIALSSPLVWQVSNIPHTRYLRANWQRGHYTLLSRGRKYQCYYSLQGRSNPPGWQWWHRTSDIDLAKRACGWHVAKGVWPTEEDEGWEFLKQ